MRAGLFSIDLFGDAKSGIVAALGDAPWLLPIVIPLAMATYGWLMQPSRARSANWLIASGIVGLTCTLAQGFAIIHRGFCVALAGSLLWAPGPVQAGMGIGAALLLIAFLLLLSEGLAGRGWCRGRFLHRVVDCDRRRH